MNTSSTDSPSDPASADLCHLLAHAGWMRRLARRLVHDADEAEEVVQEGWAHVARRPPDRQRDARPWLAEVLRNVARMRRRGARRLAAHGARLAALPVEAPPSTEDLLGRARLQRLVAELVTELDEPYRSTLLLRYFDERTAPEIARLQGVAPGTVRWRLKVAVDRLRARLDERHGGGRGAWIAALPPARFGLDAGALAGAGLLQAKLGAAIVVGAALALLALGVRLGPRGGSDGGGVPPGPLVEAVAGGVDGRGRSDGRPPAPGAPAEPPGGRVRPLPDAREAPEGRAATGPGAPAAGPLGGQLLPTLAAALEARARPLGREEAIAACLANGERILACGDAFAAAFVAMSPRFAQLDDESLRDPLVAHARGEIEADGAGPVEARRRACAGRIDARVRPTAGDRAEIDACFGLADCAAQAACAVPIFQRLKAPRRDAGAGAPP